MWAAKKLVTSRAASRHEIQQHSAQEKGMGNTPTATLGPVITRGLYCHIQFNFWCVSKIAKSDFSFLTSVPPVRSSAWNKWTPTGLILIKFYIRVFFENLFRKFKFYENLIE
jgi:hypothetical protein